MSDPETSWGHTLSIAFQEASGCAILFSAEIATHTHTLQPHPTWTGRVVSCGSSCTTTRAFHTFWGLSDCFCAFLQLSQDMDFVPSRRKRTREPAKTYNTRPSTAPLTPPQEDDGSKCSLSGSEDESDTCKGPSYPFDEDEVEVLCHFFLFFLA
jgi:hypothetical protein